jgi:hypothetical protein
VFFDGEGSPLVEVDSEVSIYPDIKWRVVKSNNSDRAPYVRGNGKVYPLRKSAEVGKSSQNGVFYELPPKLTRGFIGRLRIFEDRGCTKLLLPTLKVVPRHFEESVFVEIVEDLSSILLDKDSVLQQQFREMRSDYAWQRHFVAQSYEMIEILREVIDFAEAENRRRVSMPVLRLGQVRPVNLIRQGLSAYLVSVNDDGRYVSGPYRQLTEIEAWTSIAPMFEDLERLHDDFLVATKRLDRAIVQSQGEILLLQPTPKAIERAKSFVNELEVLFVEVERLWSRISCEVVQIETISGQFGEVPDELRELSKRVTRGLVDLEDVHSGDFQKLFQMISGSDQMWSSETVVSRGVVTADRIYEIWLIVQVMTEFFAMGFQLTKVPPLQEFFRLGDSKSKTPASWLQMSDGGVTIALGYEPAMRAEARQGASFGGQWRDDKTPDLVIGVVKSDTEFSKVAILDAKMKKKPTDEDQEKAEQYAEIGRSNFVALVYPCQESSVITRKQRGFWTLGLAPRRRDRRSIPALRYFLSFCFLGLDRHCPSCDGELFDGKCARCDISVEIRSCTRGRHNFAIVLDNTGRHIEDFFGMPKIESAFCPFCNNKDVKVCNIFRYYLWK